MPPLLCPITTGCAKPRADVEIHGVAVEQQRRSHRLALGLVVQAVERDRFGGNGNELGAHRRPYFGGMIGKSRKARRAGPKCKVVFPPKTAGGRSAGSSWRKGPQPFMGFFMFDSVAASPWCS